MATDDAPLVFRHSGPPKHQEIVGGDGTIIDAISDHIKAFIGPVHLVYHEKVSTTVHVDIHHVAPSTDGCPYHILVTSGMSERPMSAPPGSEQFAHAELFVALPPSWPIDMEAFKDEDNYWPVRLLKVLARFPHEYETWLSSGHTMGNGEPPAPYAPGTKLCGALLAPPMTAPDGFARLELSDGRVVNFWQVVALYQEEMELKIKKGLQALYTRFDRKGIGAVINPRRPNVARSVFRFW